MERQSFSNVWDAFENTPAEAASMAMRSNLLIVIEQRVRSWQVTQAGAARRLGITRPRLNDLLRGRITNSALIRSSTWRARQDSLFGLILLSPPDVSVMSPFRPVRPPHGRGSRHSLKC